MAAGNSPTQDDHRIASYGNSRPLLKDLYEHVVPVIADKWEDIGVQLLDSILSEKRVLKVIKANHPNNVEECCKNMFIKWLDTQKEATWNQVIEVIEKIGLSHQATQLKKKLKGMESDFTKESESGFMVNFTKCESVDTCFTHLSTALFKVLSKKVDFIILRRACIESSNKLGGVTLPKDLRDRIMASQNLNDLFDVLCDSPYWNWMNIKMLEKMASASHLVTASELIQQYRDEVFSRKIIEVLQYIPSNEISDNYYTKVKEKWDINLDDLMVKDLVKHWSDVERIFDVESPTILLDRLINGCVEIYWLIPTELIQHVYLCIQTKVSLLHEHHILYFKIRVKGAVTIDQIQEKNERPTMRCLNRHVIKKYAEFWEDIGLELGIEHYLLKNIKKDNLQDCVACLRETLDKWLELNTKSVTWKTLELALTNVNRANLELDPVDDIYGIEKDASKSASSNLTGLKKAKNVLDLAYIYIYNHAPRIYAYI